MKLALLAGLGMLALTGTAFAADLSVPPAAPAPALPTGYVQVYGGYTLPGTSRYDGLDILMVNEYYELDGSKLGELKGIR